MQIAVSLSTPCLAQRSCATAALGCPSLGGQRARGFSDSSSLRGAAQFGSVRSRAKPHAGLFFVIPASIKSSEAFQLALARLEASPEATELLGKPLSTGFPAGSIQVSGPRGDASLSFSVSGPNGKGTVYVEASKDMGRWKVDRMVLEQDRTGRRIDLIGDRS